MIKKLYLLIVTLFCFCIQSKAELPCGCSGSNLWAVSVCCDCGMLYLGQTNQLYSGQFTNWFNQPQSMSNTVLFIGRNGGQVVYGGWTNGNDKLILKASRGNTNLTVALGIDLEIGGGDLKMVNAGDSLDLTAGAYFKPRRISQTNEPSAQTNELVIWRDSDDNDVWLVYEDPNEGSVKVQLQ